MYSSILRWWYSPALTVIGGDQKKGVCAGSSDGDPAKILVAAHSADVDWRPLSTYDYQAYRVLHILGAFVP